MAGYADAAMRSVASSAGGLPALPSRAPPPAGSSGHHRQHPVPPPAARPRSAASSETAPDSSQRPSSPRGGEPDAEPAEDLAVRVAVRARPLVAKERLERARECLSYPDDKSVLLGQNRLFHFDDAYGPGSEQGAIYRDLVAPLVESCFNGYNATVFAYGQTGSGKTYTMGSGAHASVLEDEVGIIPRVISDVFAGAKRRRGQSEVSVRCAFLEVHNEEVRDLLHPEGGYDDDGAGAPGRKKISVRERADGAIVVSGIKEVDARSYEEMIRLLERGGAGRTTGGTKMNAESSRSHAIFTIILEQRHLTRELMRRHKGAYSVAKFHLVDLAGSERNKRTGAAGARFKESININSGLLALGNVISALADAEGRQKRAKEALSLLGKENVSNAAGNKERSEAALAAARKHLHVPYRDSKLTRLLQDSLGGNSRTCMIACVSPTDTNLEETLNTLKYAARARNIRNKPKVNRDPAAAQLAAIREDSANNAGAAFDAAGAGVSLAGLDEAGVQALRDAAEHAERDLAAKGAELSKMTVAVHAAEEEAIEARAARDHALIRVERLERECADALVLAGELNADGELTQRGFARLVAAAPESARARAVERRGGAALPKVSHADRAAAALSLAAPTVDSPSKGFGVEAGGASSRDGDVAVADAHRGGGQTGDDPTIIEGYLRELRDLRERVQAKDAEVADRDAKLEEAKEDLRRDEAIFAEKMKEIKTLRRAAKEAERERERRERTHREELAALNAALTTRAERPKEAAKGPGDALGLPPAPEAMPRTPGGGGKPAAEAAEAADVSFAGSDWELPRGLEAASGSLPATPSAALPSGAFPSGDAFEAFEEAGSGGSERDRLLREKSEIEAEKAKVEEEARRKARAHAGERRSLERQLRDLEQNISSKESLIADLERNEAEAKGLKRRYELRMRALEEEKAAKEAEVERLRAALEEMEKSGAHTAEEMREARARYERDVRAAQAQLEALRAEKRESAEIRGDEARLRAEESGKVRELEQEVARARGTRDELKRRLREREDAHAKAQALRGEEIGALKKQAETQSRRIKELVSAKERQREALRKKTDELAAANRELERLHTRPGGERRPVAGQHMVAVNAAAARLEAADAATTHDTPDQQRSAAVGVGGAMSSRERAHAYGERVKSRNRGDAGGGADRDGDVFGEKRTRSNANANANANAAASDPVVQVDVSALRAMIDAESRRALKIRLGEEERLRVEAKRRAVNEEREETTRARDALVLRSERSAAQLEKERRELVRVLDALDDRLTAALKSGGGGGASAE